jgi:anti-sigma factor RsiW
MECRTCSESLTALIDGELSRDEVASLKDHLDRCQPCRSEYVSLSYSYELVEHMDLIEPAFDQSWRRIESEIAPPAPARPSPKRRSFGIGSFFMPRWVPVTALAGAAVLAVSLFVIAPNQQRHAEVERAFRAYIQVREGRFSQSDNYSDPNTGFRLEPAVYNPFADNDQRNNRNPFKLE